MTTIRTVTAGGLDFGYLSDGPEEGPLALCLHGGPDAVLIGHDWGAAGVYGAAAHAPERWQSVVTMAVPPIASLLTGFLSYAQLKRSFYIFLFQTSLAVLALNEEFIRNLWADWSPGYEAKEDVQHAMDCLGTPRRTGPPR